MNKITCLEDFAEALVRPIKVLVIDTDDSSFSKVANALAPYDAEVFNVPCACPAAVCLQNSSFDLIFVGVPLTKFGTPDLVVEEIIRVCPEASVVIMARSPVDPEVVKLMELGPFTFLKKNGSFDQDHIQRIASQLNLKLRPNGKAGAKNRIPATENVSRV